ncbi:MAG: prepilin-type N-terminal cleavage/methylation domain-containing protein, partial [Methylomonas sp.]|nr:prepilin-type N-terminal cleavage/methylation domain-containing protein [Methylomonas sp.]
MTICRRNGFTLIEVLIAMTLLSVMVVLLFSSLRIAAESWNAGESKVAAVNKKAVVYQFFKRHLSAIRPLPMLDEHQDFSAGNQQAFQGYPQSMRFAAALPAASARKGLQLFSIALDSANPKALMVGLTPYRLSDEDMQAEPDRPEMLLDHVDDLRISYFGKTEDVSELAWREEWTTADRLPSLIKVSIRLEDGSYWPDMVFAPRIKIGRAH